VIVVIFTVQMIMRASCPTLRKRKNQRRNIKMIKVKIKMLKVKKFLHGIEIKRLFSKQVLERKSRSLYHHQIKSIIT